jgi:hypothetical protein
MMIIRSMKWFQTRVENLLENTYWKEMNKKTMTAAIIQEIKTLELNQSKVTLVGIIKI